MDADADPSGRGRGDHAAQPGAELDHRRYVFINPDLTVSPHRQPEGEWVRLDARTVVDGAGIGLAESALHDEKGPFGRSTQSLYVAARG